MNTKISLFLFVLLFHFSSKAQQIISLQLCIDSAIVHYPTYKQGAIYDQELSNKILSLKHQNLPQAEVNGRATLQNDVTSLPISLPGVPKLELSNDQYKLSLDITQSIYKGGLTAKQISLEEINSQINKQQSFIELYALKQRVVAIYYQLILNQKLYETADNLQKTLQARLKEVETAVEVGSVLKSSKSALLAEITKLSQQKSEYSFEKIKLIQQLNLLCGFSIQQQEFELPELNIASNPQQSRAEYEMLNLQQSRLNQLKTVLGSKNLPIFFGFSNLGYGRPGYNMLDNNFAGYAMLGVGMKWNAWNWQEVKHERERLDFNAQIIETKKESMLIEIQIAADQQLTEIRKQEEMMKLDEEIIRLKEDVANSSQTQMMNGSLTSSQYVDDMYKVSMAKIEAEIHKIRRSMAMVNYLWIMGKL